MSHTCCGRAWSLGAFHSHQCGKTAKYEHDGRWYCKTHHPPTVAAKTQAMQERAMKELDEKAAAQKQAAAERAEMERRAALFPEMLEALKAIVECHEVESGVVTDGHINAARVAIAKAEGK